MYTTPTSPTAGLAYSRQNASDWSSKILPLRRQAAVRDSWLKARLQTILPEVMRSEGIDMWIIVAREYNEDPVLFSLMPATMMSARRRTILVFHAPAEGPFEAMAIANAGIGLDGLYRPMWDKSIEDQAAETQWECLRRVVSDRNPARIGINIATNFAFGDGLSKNEHDGLMNALGGELAARCVSAERVAVGWLERRTATELDASGGINLIAHGIIGEAFSSRVIHPGVTTAADVSWWMRQRACDLGLTCWFHPTVRIQRRGVGVLGGPGGTPDEAILPGDFVHCDFGLHYLGLATDTQQNAYVLRRGEEAPPAGLQRLLAIANRQQDLLASSMAAGKTGNDVLAEVRSKMGAEGISGRVYTHPIGYHGHGAGSMIGLFDQQDGVPGRGDLPIVDDTLHSFEMYIEATVPEWDDQLVRCSTEQIVAFTGGEIHYMGGRQTEYHLIH